MLLGVVLLIKKCLIGAQEVPDRLAGRGEIEVVEIPDHTQGPMVFEDLSQVPRGAGDSALRLGKVTPPSSTKGLCRQKSGCLSHHRFRTSPWVCC